MRVHPAFLVFSATLGCLSLALVLQLLLFRGADAETFGRSMVLAIIVPLVTGGAILLLLRPALRELADLRQRYAHAIAHDNLTSCLNGAVFSAMVDAHPTVSSAPQGERHGAFLVIDVDDLGSINNDVGYRVGDQALRVIAGIIQASVRSDDLVGRIGGEEFGVFLPGATPQNAESVAERIRARVSEADFRTGAVNLALTVSVGAVIFEREIHFEDLVRAADQTLRRAKERGRNSIEYIRLPSASTPPPNVLH